MQKYNPEETHPFDNRNHQEDTKLYTKQSQPAPQKKSKNKRVLAIVLGIVAFAVVALVCIVHFVLPSYGIRVVIGGDFDEEETSEVSSSGESLTSNTGNHVIDNLVSNMVYVKGGTFTMGANGSQTDGADPDEFPTHQVTLSPYYIGKYEITQEEWEAVMGNNPSRCRGSKRPVDNVSWDECQSFVNKLNAMTGKNFHLPTEAQWEFAARGGDSNSDYLYSGTSNVNEIGYGETASREVGKMKANALGIYDMSNNVSEWVADWYGHYSAAVQTDPTGVGHSSEKVLRGGSFGSSSPRAFRNSNRFYYGASKRTQYLGLRIAL